MILRHRDLPGHRMSQTAARVRCAMPACCHDSHQVSRHRMLTCLCTHPCGVLRTCIPQMSTSNVDFHQRDPWFFDRTRCWETRGAMGPDFHGILRQQHAEGADLFVLTGFFDNPIGLVGARGDAARTTRHLASCTRASLAWTPPVPCKAGVIPLTPVRPTVVLADTF